MQTRNVFGHGAVCLLAAGLCFSLGACDQTEKVRQTIDKEADTAKEALSSAQNPPNPVAFDPLTITNKLWHGNTALRMHRGIPFPSRYEEPRGVTLVSSEPMSLSDIANAINQQTGIPVRITALTPPGRSGGAGSSSSSSGGASSGGSSALEMPVTYEGPLSGLLDSMSAFFGISWRYDGTSIGISRYETRIFSVEAMPGTHEINEGMQDDQSSSSGSSSSGSGGSSSSSSTSTNTLTQNSKTTINLKYWEELSGVLNTIVGGNGSAIISPTMGTVTITTTPDIMATVADYIAKENRRLGRQIAINVSIYTVNLGKNEDFGVAFSGFLKHLSGQIHNIQYQSATAPTNSSLTGSVGTLSLAILNGANSRSTTNEVFKALSAVGDTTTVAQFPMTTLNNRPVSRRIGTDTTYIASVNAVTATGTTTATTFTPVVSTIHDGFSLQLTPRLLDDGRILLQYSLGLIGIQSMGATTFDEGGGVQVPLSLPITDNRIFVQQSMLRSGQTLVIGGVDQTKMQQSKQGVGTPENFVLGGGTSSQEDHLMMFISVTPQVMDVAVEEQS
ncbi:MAG: secretin N-terminal domain-containing protein [Alphaproteobacteria bacterium]|nr:secretin N-terminal domain-containing protein [Alphaproteobacteria bacterium]